MANQSSAKLDIPLDILGQQPDLFKLYTQLSFVFTDQDQLGQSHIVDTLTRGLQRLTEAFPWLDGRIVRHEDAKDGPLYRLESRKDSHKPLLTVRDYRNDNSKAFQVLAEAKWPISMLHETWLCPRNTLGMLDEETGAEVFFIQANLIDGGVIVSFVGQHNVMDMAGLAEVIRLFDQACRNGSFTVEDLESGHSFSKTRYPLLNDDWSHDASADRYHIKASAAAVLDGNDPEKAPEIPATWHYFEFSADNLAKLKAVAMKDKLDTVNYVTTDDALTALVWRSTCRARGPRLPADWPSTFARAIDGRPFTGMSPRFPGLNTSMAYTDGNYGQLSKSSVGETASNLRLALNPDVLSHTTRVLATMMSRTANKSSVSVTANLDFSKSIALSSWAKYNLCDLGFGLDLGVPKVVRRPGFQPVEGLMYFMPHARDGSIAAAICLRDEDMERLRSDGEFGEYALHVG